MTIKTEMVCIVCPLGCKMSINFEQGIEFAVEGNQCARGNDYALEEATNPTRIVTSTVKIINSHLPRLPVKTDSPIPKDLIFPCMKQLEDVEVKSPVKKGEIIIQDLFGTGVNIVATKSM